jgi:hypothetical protein
MIVSRGQADGQTESRWETTMNRISTAARELGWDTVSAQTFNDEQVAEVNAFVAEHEGEHDTIADVIDDMRALGYDL